MRCASTDRRPARSSRRLHPEQLAGKPPRGGPCRSRHPSESRRPPNPRSIACSIMPISSTRPGEAAWSGGVEARVVEVVVGTIGPAEQASSGSATIPRDSRPAILPGRPGVKRTGDVHPVMKLPFSPGASRWSRTNSSKPKPGSDVGAQSRRSDLLLVAPALSSQLVALLLADHRVVLVDRGWQLQDPGDGLLRHLGTESGPTPGSRRPGWRPRPGRESRSREVVRSIIVARISTGPSMSVPSGL